MRIGAQFIVFDGSGIEFLVEIEEFSKREIICIVKEEKTGVKRTKNLSLCFSMIKKENMELILQKCTEIGVTSFFPLISERTVKTGWNADRMEKIVNEAVEQSGFSDIPTMLQEPMKLEKLLEKFKREKENMDGLCVLDFDGVMLSSLKHLISVDTIFVGPEGGWTEKERNLFDKYHVKKISLGRNVLRAETACIASSAIFLL
jgi:16S rRNA (uracil1498-N3)-methyltransferase